MPLSNSSSSFTSTYTYLRGNRDYKRYRIILGWRETQKYLIVESDDSFYDQFELDINFKTTKDKECGLNKIEWLTMR